MYQEINRILDEATAAEAAGDHEKALCLLELASRKEALIQNGIGYSVNNLLAAG